MSTHDIENTTDLAETLDSFLTNSRAAAKSSAELFIRRNTLRQRIQRIEELIGRSPTDLEDWVTAGAAVRLIRESEKEIAKPGQRVLPAARWVSSPRVERAAAFPARALSSETRSRHDRARCPLARGRRQGSSRLMRTHVKH